jgi:hypothetical protein
MLLAPFFISHFSSLIRSSLSRKRSKEKSREQRIVKSKMSRRRAKSLKRRASSSLGRRQKAPTPHQVVRSTLIRLKSPLLPLESVLDHPISLRLVATSQLPGRRRRRSTALNLVQLHLLLDPCLPKLCLLPLPPQLQVLRHVQDRSSAWHVVLAATARERTLAELRNSRSESALPQALLEEVVRAVPQRQARVPRRMLRLVPN